MDKIKIKQAIVVEGKYDKIKVSAVVDGIILVTNGFEIYKNPNTVNLLKFYAKNQGIVILTDSDKAGNQIRGHIKSIVPEGKIINLYIPEIFGKEKRKSHPSKEGKLGVEGIDVNIIRDIFLKADLLNDSAASKVPITKADFYELGLSGKENSTKLREKLAESLDLPKKLSSSALCSAVSVIFSKDDFVKYVELFKEENNLC